MFFSVGNMIIKIKKFVSERFSVNYLKDSCNLKFRIDFLILCIFGG